MAQFNTEKTADLLLRLHELIRRGEGDGMGANEVREQLEHLWPHLSSIQQERMDGLSADLYMLQREEILEPLPAGETPQSIARQIAQAFRDEKWDILLHLLRFHGRLIPEAQVAYVRARSYESLQLGAVALAFVDHAGELEQQNSSYPVWALDLLDRMGRREEAAARSEQILANEDSMVPVMAKAADILYRSTWEMTPDRANAMVERIVALLRDILPRFPREAALTSLHVAGYVTLGTALEHLGQVDEALAAYGEALHLNPNSDGALVARGLLLYESNPEQGRRDLEQAVRQNTPLV